MDDAAKKALLKLFHCFNLGGDEEEKKFKYLVYCETLSELPDAAVISVCNRAMRGEIGGGFLPSSAELYQAALPKKPYKPRPVLNSGRGHLVGGTLYLDGFAYSADDIDSANRGVWPPPSNSKSLKVVGGRDA